MPDKPNLMVRINDALIVHLSADRNGSTDEHLSGFLKAIENETVDIRTVAPDTPSPWSDESLIAAIGAVSRRQFLVLTDDLSFQSTAIALLALEHGYDVFLAHKPNRPFNPHALLRLKHAGVTVLTYPMLLEEALAA